jgi:hypothetical protein
MTPKILCAVIDDYPDWQERVTKHLEANGFKVVAKAASLSSGLALVPKLKALGVSVVTLDGSLDQSSNDGNVIGKTIAKEDPQILRVGMSSFLDGVTECDIVVGKENLEDLSDTIKELLSQNQG